MTPPNKKNGKKTHRTCSQYINLKIETIYRSIGPLVKKLLMLKVTVGLVRVNWFKVLASKDARKDARKTSIDLESEPAAV